jgi:8-oxo-dGTP pyrophosphatase MutT (NUDIX family)
MEPLLKEKRQVAVYIPYRRTVLGDIEFYLQKRDMDAPTHAGIFSMFGGGVEENEDILSALRREVKEELCYEPLRPIYLTQCERSIAVFHVFVEEVASDFEKHVDVQEGEYGAFLTITDCETVDISEIARLVITDMSEWLAKKE